ncbi:ABC transporter ATP-binding protein [Rhodococcoides yunnanense]|jgi:peptide/nickel transport system ATP-binding protein|uniref:ABC transporter ATP-binding protein n=1 Tax=Rhodococcoides yunnanense TaxID=278209 RepID=UPI0022B0D83E|nr:ABC transporter ATP-binding protein [Rhodococcus yunnanensis]MCZ4276741.1 ABC transporter ATP-binding protein [Rhodococcus yunnanensis]
MSILTREPVAVESGAEAHGASALLEVTDLTVVYPTPKGPFTAVESFSLTMEPGERVAIVGESGSGKTNSAMAIAGFLDPSAQVSVARMTFGRTDLNSRTQSVLPVRIPGIAVVFQDAMTSLDPVWKIGSQMRSVIRNNSKLSRRAADAEAAVWLNKVGLHDTDRVLRSRPYELSGGMRQRVMIALALCAKPALLIADEPTSALDATLSRELMQLMVSLAEEFDTAMLVVSHDIALCSEFTHRTVVMKSGRVVEELPSATIAEAAQDPYTQGLLACIPTLDSALLDRLPTMNTYVGAGK